jgi:YidC/Oxa1 family membrane protein insertase
MDRNSAIGLTLIAAILVVYFMWFSPPPPQPQKPTTTEASQPKKENVIEQTPVVADSTLASTYGNLSELMKGEESAINLETADLKLTFSSHGGIITEAELTKFKTYSQEPLRLITPTHNQFKLLGQYQGKEIDLYSLYYQGTQQKNGDTTVVTFTANLPDGSKISHIYKIPAAGYEIGYNISAPSISGDALQFHWKNILKPVEKDLHYTRIHSTVTYYQEEEGYDYLKEASNSPETEAFTTPVKWVGIKEKFFLMSIISNEKPFANGEVQTTVDLADSSVVKTATVRLAIPKADLASGASYKFYIGPNDYQVIGDVTESFAKNVYLGWPPVYWINKFVVFPVFHFLTKYIGNYGLIIVILVLLLKLVLLPLSYKSYLSMAKMKVLKPELDEIKARVGEDMTKVQQEQMKLYQQVGVNPISGCIPVLLQMPLIFAMFYLFPNSIELRQQSLFWAEDLSTYDSLIHLPAWVPFVDGHISLFTVIMTISTLIYTWQNSQMTSVSGPMAYMQYIMPLIFFFVLNSFPAGLTFYYFVSNMVTFGQQAVIRRFVDENKIRQLMDENRKKIAAGGGKKSKFMTKLEDAMKASEEARKKADEDKKKKK